MRVIVRLLLLLGVAGLVLVIGVAGASEMVRRRTYAVPVRAMAPPPADAVARREGERLAHVLGCTSCHGRDLSGAVFVSEPYVAELIAPNLTRLVPSYSDGELARAVRHGVGRDGRGLLAMPAPGLFHLADEDLAPLLAYLRRLPRQDGVERLTSVGPLGRIGLLTGRLAAPAASLDHDAPRLPPAAAGESVARGRYLAHIACAECHGATLQGDGARTPPLAIGAAYSDEAFRQLLRTGETPGGRDLERMDDTARTRFVHLTDEEITAIHAYVRALAGGASP